MKEYIERTEALDICQKEYEDRLRMADYCGDTVAWNIGGAIKSLPAADVAEVVRCQDCKNLCVGGVWFGDARWGCKILEVSVGLDFFCGFGERKEDEHEAW